MRLAKYFTGMQCDCKFGQGHQLSARKPPPGGFKCMGTSTQVTIYNDPCLKLVFSFLRTGPNWINYVQFFFPNITLLKEVIHKIGDNVYIL